MLRSTIPSFTLKQRLQSFLAFARDPLAYFQQLVASSPDQEIYAFPLLYKRCYLLSHPDDVRTFFKRTDLFQKKSIDFAIFRQTLGNGIFVSEGEIWQQQRALMNPMFTRKQVLAFVPAIASAAEEMGRQWEALPAIDAWQSNKAFALRVMGEVLVRNHPQMEAVGVHFEAIERYIVDLFQTPLPIPKWVPLPQNRRLVTAHKHLATIIAQIREERHRTPLPPGEVDVLSTLVDTQQKQKHDPQQTVTMTDQQIVDEMVTLLFGGHETTAATLTWIWYALATYPQARRVYEEVDQVLGEPGQEPRHPSAEDLELFPYTSMFINECLRLWPPAPFTNRVVMQETELRGYTLPAGSTCFVCAYSMHHNPTYYPDPDHFDPDRFSPAQKQLRPAQAYFPFGAGPHSCIGMSLAMVELLLAVVTIVRSYHIERITEEPVEAKMQPSLRPVAFTIRVKKRVQNQLLVEQ